MQKVLINIYLSYFCYHNYFHIYEFTGIWAQFVRFYGEEDHLRQLVKVKAVFITHLHADHHVGTYTFINKRKKAFEKLGLKYEKLFLCAPPNLFSYFKMVDGVCNSDIESDSLFLSAVNLIDNQWLNQSDTIYNENELISQRIESLKSSLDLSQILTVPVLHIEHSMALVLVQNGTNFKLAYSGDCKPTSEFIKLGKKCDLLIHEATYNDDFRAVADMNMHSTVSQALRVGRSMNATHTCLTHFYKLSNKNSWLYTLRDVIVAEDNMVLNPSNFASAKLLNAKRESLLRR